MRGGRGGGPPRQHDPQRHVEALRTPAAEGSEAERGEHDAVALQARGLPGGLGRQGHAQAGPVLEVGTPQGLSAGSARTLSRARKTAPRRAGRCTDVAEDARRSHADQPGRLYAWSL